MHNILQAMMHAFEDLGPWAYGVAALLALGESVIILAYLLPGVVLMAFIGFLCYLGVYHFWGMVAVVFAGHLAGELLNYTLGRRKGRPLFQRHNRYLKLSLLDKVEQGFGEGALHLMLAGHFVGVLRPVISFTAGMTHYSLCRFTWVMTGVSFVWAVIHLGAGYVLGAGWQRATEYLGLFGLVFGAIVLALSARLWLIHRRRRAAGRAGSG